MGFLAI